jgi:hypothetical protein
MGRFVYSNPNMLPLDVADYATTLSQSNLAYPASSWLLLKATGQVPHGGGKVWELGSDAVADYTDWLSKGATWR